MSIKTGLAAIAFAAALSAAQAGIAEAAVPQAEADRLKSALTPMGAERAGNADGSIPAWTGGMTSPLPGYRTGGQRPDPFPGERPLVTITAANAASYSQFLSDGVRAMFAKYPDYRIEVFPSHRTAAAPQWVYDNTYRNATTAQALDGGLRVSGAYGGVPFPIPKTGAELIRNHLMSWRGVTTRETTATYATASNGSRVVTAAGSAIYDYPFYHRGGAADSWNGFIAQFLLVVTQPELVAGDNVLNKFSSDMIAGDQTWQYLSGQRRARRAPQLSYDNTAAQNGGLLNIDETGSFYGAIDRYDWAIAGKREMFVPYNTNKFGLAPVSEAYGPHFLNPALVRWEKHRVWVLDAVLASGKRNTVARRRYYLDEDTWKIVGGEGYDAQNKLWRVYIALPFVAPDFPAVLIRTDGIYNMQTGAYVTEFSPNEQQTPLVQTESVAANTFTLEGLLANSQR